MGKLDKLQPAAVWQIFENMNDIPRGSGNETGVMTMLKGWADARSLAWREDAVGNLLIEIPATKGLEKAGCVTGKKLAIQVGDFWRAGDQAQPPISFQGAQLRWTQLETDTLRFSGPFKDFSDSRIRLDRKVAFPPDGCGLLYALVEVGHDGCIATSLCP